MLKTLFVLKTHNSNCNFRIITILFNQWQLTMSFQQGVLKLQTLFNIWVGFVLFLSKYYQITYLKYNNILIFNLSNKCLIVLNFNKCLIKIRILDLQIVVRRMTFSFTFLWHFKVIKSLFFLFLEWLASSYFCFKSQAENLLADKASKNDPSLFWTADIIL